MTAFMEEYEGDFNEYYEGDEGDWGGYEEGAEEVIDDAHFDSQLAFAVPKKSKKAGKQSVGNLPPPSDAAEYLRRVAEEAAGMPLVHRSNINPVDFRHTQTRYIPSVKGAARCPPALLPGEPWELRFASHYADVRQALLQYMPKTTPSPPLSSSSPSMSAPPPSQLPLPDSSDSESWLTFMLGSSSSPSSPSPSPASSTQSTPPSSSSSSSVPRPAPPGPAPPPTSITTTSGHSPVLSIISRLDQIRTRRLIAFLGGAVEARFGRRLCLWLWALLVKLDKPVDGDMSNTLRDLYRALSRVRARCLPGAKGSDQHTQGEQDQEGQEDQQEEDSAVAPVEPDTYIHCNLLLTIIARGFDQAVAAV